MRSVTVGSLSEEDELFSRTSLIESSLVKESRSIDFLNRLDMLLMILTRDLFLNSTSSTLGAEEEGRSNDTLFPISVSVSTVYSPRSSLATVSGVSGSSSGGESASGRDPSCLGLER